MIDWQSRPHPNVGSHSNMMLVRKSLRPDWIRAWFHPQIGVMR
jgi:hypothetical protein